MEEIDYALGKRMMMMRQVVGLTQDELARRTGISFQQLYAYERGISRIPASDLYVVARELGIDINCLFEGPDYVPRASTANVIRLRRHTE